VLSIAQVPTPEEEDGRHLHRELQALKGEATRHVNRIKGLLASLGLVLEIDKHFEKRLKEVRQWDGQPVPEGMKLRLLHEFERLQVVNRQIRELARQRSQTIKRQSSPQIEQVKKLLGLRAVGVNGAWLLVQEFFGWRKTGVPPTGAKLADWKTKTSGTVSRLDAA
jgi:transposase